MRCKYVQCMLVNWWMWYSTNLAPCCNNLVDQGIHAFLSIFFLWCTIFSLWEYVGSCFNELISNPIWPPFYAELDPRWPPFYLILWWEGFPSVVHHLSLVVGGFFQVGGVMHCGTNLADNAPSGVGCVTQLIILRSGDKQHKPNNITAMRKPCYRSNKGCWENQNHEKI